MAVATVEVAAHRRIKPFSGTRWIDFIGPSYSFPYLDFSHETLTPPQAIDHLNHHLGEMNDAILNHGWTLAPYTGDGIFAVFGAPLELPDHPDRAPAAAREMLSPPDDLVEVGETEIRGRQGAVEVWSIRQRPEPVEPAPLTKSEPLPVPGSAM